MEPRGVIIQQILATFLYGQVQQTAKGFMAELIKSGPPNFAGDEMVVVILEVEFQTENRLRIQLHDNQNRYRVPFSIP